MPPSNNATFCIFRKGNFICGNHHHDSSANVSYNDKLTRQLRKYANREKALIRHFTLTFAAMTTKLPSLTINVLISGFHRASLLSVTFINQLMHSNITVVDVKILLYKSLKDTH